MNVSRGLTATNQEGRGFSRPFCVVAWANPYRTLTTLPPVVLCPSATSTSTYRATWAL